MKRIFELTILAASAIGLAPLFFLSIAIIGIHRSIGWYEKIIDRCLHCVE